MMLLGCKFFVPLYFQYGILSSVGRAPDCGSGCHGFEPHRIPQKRATKKFLAILFLFILFSWSGVFFKY